MQFQRSKIFRFPIRQNLFTSQKSKESNFIHKYKVIADHLEDLKVIESVDFSSVRNASTPSLSVSELFASENANNSDCFDEFATENSNFQHFALLPYLRNFLIISHRQQNRFNVFEKGLVGILLGRRFHRVYLEIWNRIENKISKPIHLYGPSGMGKSFILYGVACTLLQDHVRFKADKNLGKQVHVVYIRDASRFSGESYVFRHFIESLCVACYDRADILEKLISVLNVPYYTTSEYLNKLGAILEIAKLGNLVVIVDQLNDIPEKVRIHWEMLHSFLLSVPQVCVVTSASANYFDSEYIHSSFPIPLRVSENEALQLLSMYGMLLSRKDSEFASKIAEIKRVTGFIPLELRLFAETKINDFGKKVHAFVHQRTKTMYEMHSDYVKQLNSDSKISYQEALLAIDSRIKNTSLVFDRRFLVESDDPRELPKMVPSSGSYLVPISDVARQLFIDRIESKEKSGNLRIYFSSTFDSSASLDFATWKTS